MPPKTTAAPSKSARPAPKEGHKAPPAAAKTEEPAGPTIKSSITNSAPARPGVSFLDALRANKKTAAPAAAAVVAAPVAEVEVKAVAAAAPVPNGHRSAAAGREKESEAPAPSTSTPATPASPTPAPATVEEPETVAAEPVKEKAPAVEEAAAVSAAAPVQQPTITLPTSADGRFNWTTEDDFNFQFQQPAAPRLAVEYPAGVLDSRARNIVFKAATDSQTHAAAIDAITRQRTAFDAEKSFIEDRLRVREQELNTRENDLAARERQVRVDAEKLQQERIQFQLQAQQQSRPSASQSPAAQVTAPPQPVPTPAQQLPPQSRNAYMGMGGGYGEWGQPTQPDPRWAGNGMADMAGGGFDMYNQYGQQSGGFAPMNRGYGGGSNFRGSGGHMGGMLRGGNMGPGPNVRGAPVHHMQQQQFAGNNRMAQGGNPGAMGFAARQPQQQQQPAAYGSYGNKPW